MKIIFTSVLYLMLALEISCFLSSQNPLKLLGKCISDSECEANEFCDHTGLNPIGKCQIGYENKKSCSFDRHCRSKNCHLLKCVGKKPVKDGPCNKDQHDECLPEQYCSKSNGFKCKDRKCKGVCSKDFHCLSGDCSLFRCKKSSDVSLTANFCK